MRAKLRLLLIATLISTPLPAIGQENEFPTLNTIGRFLGVGYSHTGYHGRRDGRFDAIQKRHPASNYGSSGLLYPYDPGYRPVRPMRMPAPAMMHSSPSVAPAMPKIAPPQPATEPEQVATPEPAPPKPTIPPPQWLKPHLKQSETDQSPERVEPKNEVFGELTPPRPPSSRAESPFFLEPGSPSDRPQSGNDSLGGRRADEPMQDSLLGDDLLGDDLLRDDPLGPANDSRGQGGDSLLDDSGSSILNDADDDDLLLLDDDDLSARRYQRPTAAEPRTATQPSNRRKVSILQGAIPSSSGQRQTSNAPRIQAGFVDYQRSQPAGVVPRPQQYPAQQPRFTAPPRQPYQHRVQTVRPTVPVVRYYGTPPRSPAVPRRMPNPQLAPQQTMQPQQRPQPRIAAQEPTRRPGYPSGVATVPTRVVSHPVAHGPQFRTVPAAQVQPLPWQARPIAR